MSGQITFTMIKPLAVKEGHTGKILNQIIEAGFKITALKQLQLMRKEAESFYEIHKDRPFYTALVEYMISGPIVAAMLRKGTQAVAEFRELIGTTDPAMAAPGTIRRIYGTNVTKNAIHGSDSDENALRECRFFFSELEETC